ncbi:MAG: hypothetical protein JF886_06435 [Candidatus Dormibacteraeota bacterium]|uniref:Uncharacterized protein n=1 Tax=Candidatus Aeolococcus gillhamiae TaxID=3127015 RepID=A0A934JRV6_9BACT|nr:hypothetical protein [Candidatus Dormibacteraeota bacterium]
MVARLRGVRLKIERAKFQCDALENEIKAWVESQRSHVAFEHERDTGWHRLIVRMDADPDPPPMWGVIVGEIIHDLRSALDHTVWELVIANKGRPERNRNQFPIFSHPPKRVADYTKCVRGVDPRAQAIIEGLQPYTRPKRATPELIEVLGGMSNIDKHQTLHPTVVVASRINSANVDFAPQGLHRVAEMRWDKSLGQPIRNAELWAVRIEPPETEVQMKVNLQIPAGVAFGERYPMEVLKLNELVTEVGRIVDLLEPFASK